MQRSISLFLHSTATSQRTVLPTRWQSAVKKIPTEKVLPPKLGGEGEQKWKYAAWKGDKLLGASAATLLDQSDESKHLPYSSSAGGATRLTNLALSNSFFAAHVETVLPKYKKEARNLSDKDIGTMLEAAVARVHAIDEKAVSDLVSFLVHEAKTSLRVQEAGNNKDMNYEHLIKPLKNLDYQSAKKTLLEMGGTVRDAIRIGGSDHKPIFQATATFDNPKTAVATAGSKKKAERLAASKLLNKLNV